MKRRLVDRKRWPRPARRRRPSAALARAVRRAPAAPPATPAPARKGAALCLPRSPRPASTRRRSATSTRARHRAHLRGAATPTTTWRGRSRSSRSPPTAMPEVSRRLPDLDRRGSGRGIYFADDPAFKGKRRELVAAGLRLLVQAPRRPGAARARRDRRSRTTGIVGLRRAARGGARRARSRSTTTARSRACGRSTATRCASSCGEPRPRFLDDLADARPARRGGARGGRVLRRPDRWRTRSAPARSGWPSGGAARASCSSATPTSARCSTTPSPPPTTPRARRCWQRFKGRRLPMVDRVEISIIEENQPRWLVVRQRRARLHRARAATSSRNSAMPERQARAEPGQARHPAATAIRAPTSRCSYFNMEDPVVGGYTPEKVALRRAISLGLRRRRGDPHSSGAARRSRRSRRCCRCT